MTEFDVDINNNEFTVKGYVDNRSYTESSSPDAEPVPVFEIREIWYNGTEVSEIISGKIEIKIQEEANEYAKN